MYGAIARCNQILASSVYFRCRIVEALFHNSSFPLPSMSDAGKQDPDTTPRAEATPQATPRSEATTKVSMESPGVSPRGGGEEVAHAVVAEGIEGAVVDPDQRVHEGDPLHSKHRHNKQLTDEVVDGVDLGRPRRSVEDAHHVDRGAEEDHDPPAPEAERSSPPTSPRAAAPTPVLTPAPPTPRFAPPPVWEQELWDPLCGEFIDDIRGPAKIPLAKQRAEAREAKKRARKAAEEAAREEEESGDEDEEGAAGDDDEGAPASSKEVVIQRETTSEAPDEWSPPVAGPRSKNPLSHVRDEVDGILEQPLFLESAINSASTTGGGPEPVDLNRLLHGSKTPSRISLLQRPTKNRAAGTARRGAPPIGPDDIVAGRGLANWEVPGPGQYDQKG